VLGNDNFGGDGPSTGTIALGTVSGGFAAVDDGGTPSDPTDDTIDFTPTANFNGNATVQYIIEDSTGDQSTATLTIPVTSVDDTPSATGETVAAVLEDSATANHVVLGNDDFGGDGPSTSAITLGTVSGGLAAVNEGGTPSDPTDDTIDFTPTANFNGSATVQYTIEDSDGDQAGATLTIPVSSVDDTPSATGETVAAVLEDSATANHVVLGNDNFGGDGPSTGTIALGTVSGGFAAVNDGGTPSDPTDDTIDFTPTANFNGSATVQYTIEDSDGDQATATLTIPVTSVVTTTVHIGDLDGSSAAAPRGRWDATVAFTVHDAGENPIAGATVDGAWSNGANGGGSCITDAGGQCSVQKQNLKGNVASVDFAVGSITGAGTYDSPANHDPDGDSNGTAITIFQSGAPVNLLPNAVDDSNTTTVDTPVIGNVLANDDQGDAPATVTSYDAVGTLGGGVTMAPNGDYTYTPPSGVSGVDTFGYTITDADVDTSSATVTITINLPGGGVTIDSATGYKVKGVQHTDLTWSGATSTDVDIVRDGVIVVTVPATLGAYTDNIGSKGGGSYNYNVCEAGTATCAGITVVVF